MTGLTAVAAADTAMYQQVCASSTKTLCLTYPSTWNRTSIRIERSKDQEKITALYAYHQIDADTGFAEGLEASSSLYDAEFKVKMALAEDIQARKEILSTVIYSASGINWYVISGTDFRGNIFYSKLARTDRSLKMLNILYPSGNKLYWNRILRIITQNFK